MTDEFEINYQIPENLDKLNIIITDCLHNGLCSTKDLMQALRIVCYNKESLKWQRNTKEKVK